MTARHAVGMVLRMKTTLNIDDRVMIRLRRERRATSGPLSELVETALRGLQQAKPAAVELRPVPSFSSGGALANAQRFSDWRRTHGEDLRVPAVCVSGFQVAVLA